MQFGILLLHGKWVTNGGAGTVAALGHPDRLSSLIIGQIAFPETQAEILLLIHILEITGPVWIDIIGIPERIIRPFNHARIGVLRAIITRFSQPLPSYPGVCGNLAVKFRIIATAAHRIYSNNEPNGLRA